MSSVCQQRVFQRDYSKTFVRVLPTRWLRKPAGIEITSVTCPMHRMGGGKKSVMGQLVQKIVWKQTDGQTNATDRFTLPTKLRGRLTSACVLSAHQRKTT